jgi:hypothetical protein
MSVEIRTRPHEICQVPLARPEYISAQRTAKQFVPQPHLVSADHVGLAVVSNLLDLALAEVAFHLAAVEPLGLSGQTHDPADLVKSGLPLRTERREDVAQIDGILGVSMEVGAGMKPRRGHPMDHGPISQHGQVEAVAVEGDELRAQLRDLVAEGGDQRREVRAG